MSKSLCSNCYNWKDCTLSNSRNILFCENHVLHNNSTSTNKIIGLSTSKPQISAIMSLCQNCNNNTKCALKSMETTIQQCEEYQN